MQFKRERTKEEHLDLAGSRFSPSRAILPTSIFRPFAGVEVRLYGRRVNNNPEPVDWSLARLTTLEEVGGNLPPVCALIFQANQCGDDAPRVERMYAPRPSNFNAKICRHQELQTVFEVADPFQKVTHSFECWPPLYIHRGVDADGCDIPAGSAFLLSSADCFCVVLRARSGCTYAAHAGRDSLFDRKKLLEGRPSREHESVVDALIERARADGANPRKLQGFITCGIGACAYAHSWNDPRHGALNRKICEHFLALDKYTLVGAPAEGLLDLAQIIRLQFQRHGVPIENITTDGHESFHELNHTGDYLWWSSHRALVQKQPADRTKRNLVLVVNRGLAQSESAEPVSYS